MGDFIIVNPNKLRDLCTDIFVGMGSPRDEAWVIADCLVDADLRNVQSHGVTRVKMYTDQIDAGGSTAAANMETVSDSPSLALLNANGAVGIVAAYKAMELAIEKARSTGVGVVFVQHSNHFSAAAYYTKMAAEEGMIGFACSNAPCSMAPWGSKTKFLGTNPFSVAIPATETPIVLDMATSVVARGKIILANKKQTTIPEGWAIDVDGNPTTDAAAALAGSVLPFGGHKGSGISMAIDILCGLLTGSGYGTHMNNPFTQAEVPMDTGHCFIAIDVNKIMPAAIFAQSVEAYKAEVKALDKASWAEDIYLPGEIAHAKSEKNEKEGIQLSVAVSEELHALADRLDIPFDITM